MKIMNEIIRQVSLKEEDNPAKIIDKPVNEVIVIYDECGDTLWDAVLEQEYTDIIF